jgi:hypothetical protein
VPRSVAASALSPTMEAAQAIALNRAPKLWLEISTQHGIVLAGNHYHRTCQPGWPALSVPSRAVDCRATRG